MKRSGVGMTSVWIVASAMTAGSTSVIGELVLRSVALSGDPAPDTGAGVVFDHFNTAEIVINDAGQVAFRSVLAGPGVNGDNDRGIWSEGDGALSLVAREGSPAPGTAAGVEFSGLLDPFLSDDGTVGFYGFLRGPGVSLDENHIGIWSGPPGDLSLIARLGTQAPGLDPGTNFGVFNTPAYGHFGEAAYFSLLSGTGVDGTNFRSIWSEDMGSPRLVARMGSSTPDTDPGVVFENFGFPVINGAGQSAFHATVSGPGVDASNAQGFWSEGSGFLALVARQGSSAPDTEAGTDFADLNNVAPQINDAGAIAFTAGLTGPAVTITNDRGVWSEGSGTLGLVARKGEQAPGMDPGVVFSDVFVDEIPGLPGDPFGIATFTGHVINSGGRTAFVGGVTGPGVDETNQLGIWSERAGILDLVARTGSQAPGTAFGVQFVFFGYLINDALSLNAEGDVAFRGVVTGMGVDGTNNTGVWAQVDGDLTLVVRAGDELELAPGDIRTISFVSFITGSGGQDGQQTAFNTLGQLAFGAGFTDGSSGVFVATWSESSDASTVYDNTTTFAGTHNDLMAVGQTDSTEHGNQITLEGPGRVVTEIVVYLGVACCGAASFDAQVRFYANDGPGGQPGMLLWQSDPMPQIIDSGNPDPIPIAYFFAVPNVLVPDTFTWTVQITNRDGNLELMGPSEYNPPSVGSAPFGFWRLTAPDTWEFAGPAEPPFGARVTVESGAKIPAVSEWGVVVMILLTLTAGTLIMKLGVSAQTTH